MNVRLLAFAGLASMFTFQAQSAPVFGDLDGKNGVRINDVTICLRHVKNIHVLKGDGLAAADVDQNGKVDDVDCSLIRLSAAGMLSLPAKIIFGDLNGNGRVEIADLTIIMRHLKNISTLTGNRKIAADVNLDGVIDEKDSELIRRAAGGLEKLPKTP